MDIQESTRLTSLLLPRLIERMGLRHWSISTEQTTLVDAKAKITPLYNYKRAVVRINYKEIDTATVLCRVLRHELGHLVISPFDYILDTLSELVQGDEVQMVMFSNMRTHGEEQSILNLENMWDCGEMLSIPTLLGLLLEEVTE